MNFARKNSHVPHRRYQYGTICNVTQHNFITALQNELTSLREIVHHMTQPPIQEQPPAAWPMPNP